MIIIDKPYLSGLLADTLREYRFEVLRSRHALELLPDETINYLSEPEAIQMFRANPGRLLYASSENSIAWITKHLGFTELPGKINIFKDKTKFRKLLAEIYPAFFFREFNLDELDIADPVDYPFPVIIKPAVGFFSLGVHKINHPAQWPEMIEKIKSEVNRIRNTYPPEVLDTTKFIIEEIIEGDEYTIDAYFDASGRPVILGMMRHYFASPEDTSDRLYLTSKKIISENLARFTGFLKIIGSLADLRNFPLHMEVRVSAKGTIMPIEVNPLRFGGWCTSAELTHYAFGFNPYVMLMQNQEPEWNKILDQSTGHLFSIIILNNNSGYKPSEIRSFDYDKLLRHLEKPLELRKADVAVFHLFGFVYAETAENNFDELEKLLKSDLREFIVNKENSRPE